MFHEDRNVIKWLRYVKGLDVIKWSELRKDFMNHAIDNSGSRKPKLASTEAFSADNTVIVTVLLCVSLCVAGRACHHHPIFHL